MGETPSSQTAAWLILNASGLSPERQSALVEAFGDAERVLGAGDADLRAVDGIDARHISRLRDAQETVDPAALAEKLQDIGGSIIPITDEGYPPLLREIPTPPTVLFVSGALDRRDELSVAIVGTRKRTDYGQRVAEQLSSELARRGFTIVSGLAMGIDTDAHTAALDVGGRTIAVTACGLDVDYPRRNRELRRRIADSGAVVTELALGTEPLRERFEARNRIIAGLSLGTVVVEAPDRSGALITARLAAEYGRQVFAVPGSVLSPTSRGCNALIRDGVTLVGVAEDIVEGLGIMLQAVPEREPAAERERKLDELPADQRAVLEVLSHEPRNIDDIIARAGQPAAQVTGALMLLEIKGLVRRFPGNTYVST
ncbi:MAG: DNA-processing protein DprA [Armatimonadetes bacterium]|nr:DNA-processing protein DprA [Armatimonadota bacterium]